MVDTLPFQIERILKEWALEYCGPISDPEKQKKGLASVHLVKPLYQGQYLVLKEMPLSGPESNLMKTCYTRLEKVLDADIPGHTNIFLPKLLKKKEYTIEGKKEEFGFLLSDYMPFGYEDLQDPDGIPIEVILRFGLDVATALKETHENGFVHCDVKGANVFMSADGVAKLADYDCAQRIGATDGRNGLMLCTVSHFPPDLLKKVYRAGEYEVTPAQDIYSLGCMIYREIEGTFPYARYAKGMSDIEIIKLKLDEIFRQFSKHMPGEVSYLLEGCLSPEISYRPDAAQVISVLEKFAAPRSEVVLQLHKDKSRLSKSEELTTFGIAKSLGDSDPTQQYDIIPDKY